tara:strand:- start:42 stop:1529 length:1488 start_codon:yes stop_codon:yes gene_type:complete
MAISFETPDFTDFKASIDKESKEKLKKIQNEDTRINEIIKKMESSIDSIQIIEYCVEWKTLDPESPVPDIVKADAYRTSKQNEKAQELFKNVIKKYPTYGWTYERYGYFLIHFGKYEEAIDHFDTAIKIDKTNVSALCGKGTALFFLKKYDEAIECCDAALKMEPNNNFLLLMKGHALLLVPSKSQEAVDHYDKLLDVNPNDVSALGGKGAALSHLKKFQEALVCYDAALKMEPNNEQFLNEKGIVLTNFDKFQEAIDCYDTALEIVDLSNDRRASILKDKGFALAHLKKYEEAIECYDTALGVDVSHTSVVVQDMLYAQTLTAKMYGLFFLKKYQDALDISEKLLKIDENDDKALLSKAFALDNLGKTPDAIKWMDVLEEKVDKNLDFGHWDCKGEMLDKLKRYHDSIACYTKSLSIEENKDTRKSLNAVIEKQNKLQKEDGSNEANNNEKPQWKNDPATDAQKQYIKKLGGDENSPKTKGEASEMITKLKEEN